MKKTFRTLYSSSRFCVAGVVLALGNVAVGQSVINDYANEDAWVISNSSFTQNTAYNGAYDNSSPSDGLSGEWLGLAAANSSSTGGRDRSYIQFTLPSSTITAGTLWLYQANTASAAENIKVYGMPASGYVSLFNDIPSGTGGSGSSPLPSPGTTGSINDNNETGAFQLGSTTAISAGQVGWVSLTFTSSQISTLNTLLGQTITLSLHGKLASGSTVDTTETIFENSLGTLESATALGSPGSATDLIDTTSMGLAGANGENQVGSLGPNGTDEEYIAFTTASSVPEPSAVVLLSVGGGLLTWMRRRSS